MSTKVMSVLAGIVAALALAAGSTAAPPKAVTVAFGIQNVGFEATCPPDVFGFSFDMVAPGGAVVGTGQTCLLSSAGCDPFVAWVRGCHRTLETAWRLSLPGGTVSLSVPLFELYPTPATFVQIGVGTVTGGTGAFAGARGLVAGGGTGAFTETGIESRLFYTVHALV